MSNIKISNGSNYPEVEGAGILGDIVNKQWSEEFVRATFPNFRSFNDMALDILIEDYNQRHASEATLANQGSKGANHE